MDITVESIIKEIAKLPMEKQEFVRKELNNLLSCDNNGISRY